MKKLIATGILTLSIGSIGSALAGPVSFDTTSSTSDGTCSSGVGNACTYTVDGSTITAQAFSTSNNASNNPFVAARIRTFSGGLGVQNTGENGSSPNHTLDNNGRTDVIIFESNTPGFSFAGFEIGFRHNDSDISAYIGDLAAGFDLTGRRFSQLAGLGFTKINFNNVPVDSTRLFGSNTGNHLILAARTNHSNDYVKVSQINGQTTTQVSEPGMLALFGIALVGFWANRRRKLS